MIHLDTNFLIGALLAGSAESKRLVAWLRQSREVAISAVAWAEFVCGPVTPDDQALARAIVGDCISFDTNAAEEAAALFNLGSRRKGSLTDCMIAGAALASGAALATNNTEDFRRFSSGGLLLEAI